LKEKRVLVGDGRNGRSKYQEHEVDSKSRKGVVKINKLKKIKREKINNPLRWIYKCDLRPKIIWLHIWIV
jgi:hypothetical protein